MLKKHCDECGQEINSEHIVLSIEGGKRFISTKHFHIDCANRSLSTDFRIIFEKFQKK